jgi:hypothetical protein
MLRMHWLKKLIPRVHEPSQTRASVEPSFSLAAGSTVSLARLSLRLARARFESRSRVRQVNETVEISSSAQLPLDSPVPTRFLWGRGDAAAGFRCLHRWGRQQVSLTQCYVDQVWSDFWSIPSKKRFSECFLSLVRNPISFGLDAIWSGRCWISCLLCEVSNPKFPKLELDTHAQKLFDVAVSCSTLLCAQVVFRAYATRGPYPLYRVCL